MGGDRLQEFVQELRRFARDTEFMAFFNDHGETYRRLVAHAWEKLGDTDYASVLEDYYGVQQNSYTVILVPLFAASGQGIVVEWPDDKRDIYCIHGPTGVEDGLPTFGRAERLRYVVLHEFGHKFVNPIADRFHKENARYRSLYFLLANQMAGQRYMTWQVCAYEHILRAVGARLVARSDGEVGGEREVRREMGRGFLYIRPLCEALQRYEMEREAYPTFEDFYPELLGVFRELSEMDPGELLSLGQRGLRLFQLSGNFEIYVMDADGSGQTNLTDNGARDLQPAWSPDGSKIAFHSNRDEDHEIYVMNADGSGQTKLTNNDAGDVSPAWSPDGSNMAFSSNRDGNWEIYVMNADGSEQLNLTNSGGIEGMPCWSSGGTRIAFCSNRDGNWEIYVMNADGSGQTKLTNNDARDWHPA